MTNMAPRIRALLQCSGCVCHPSPEASNQMLEQAKKGILRDPAPAWDHVEAQLTKSASQFLVPTYSATWQQGATHGHILQHGYGAVSTLADACRAQAPLPQVLRL
jgi:hypothetical protein